MKFAKIIHPHHFPTTKETQAHIEETISTIERITPSQPKIRVHLDPVCPRKKRVSVKLQVSNESGSIVLKKEGEDWISTLKYVRRLALQKIRKQSQRKKQKRNCSLRRAV